MLKLIRYFARLFLFVFLGVTLFWVIALRFVNPPLTWLMLQRGFERKFDRKDWKLEKTWVKYDEISDNLKRAVLAGEDQLFFKHSGFDVAAIRKAYSANVKGYHLRGGSTISQQTAKNVFLWPGRSWIRKGFEAYFTVLIELFWSKQRILEVYLNVIETGDGIYGVEAACQNYFHRSCGKLTVRRASALAAIIPSPLRWSPVDPGRRARNRQRIIRISMPYIKLEK
ncbi:MAG: monofunctional biosynthetic peptidoglycan transglycosylase [Mucilaginibacter polytrichastri]|nr:monofunctional biosynthetic peptidoglycan transglycosylase [Mucilaginibacter polytrichastri]